MILEDVKKNKVKTFFIVTLFLIFILIFVYFISLWIFDDVYIAVFLALFLSIISTLISYYNSDKMVLRLNGAKEATRQEYLQLNESLEGLCIAAGICKPKLYVIQSEALNAFATGRNPENSVICVTSGLISKLNKYEMEGVLAHELSHIKNYDILLSTIAIVMVGLVSIVADLFMRGFYRIGGKDNDNDNQAKAVLMILGLIFIILSPIFANLIKLAISRNREYLADASAVEITRNKDGLINALRKISEDDKPLYQANKTSASLYICNPFNKKEERDSLVSTHPTIKNRISRLEKIQ